MKYLVRLSSGQVTPCDEQMALQRVEFDPPPLLVVDMLIVVPIRFRI